MKKCDRCGKESPRELLAKIDGNFVCVIDRMRREQWRHDAGIEMTWDL
jgi:hypothetical protein